MLRALRRRDEPTVAKTALILSGGGARAAYQVGVLSAIAELVPRGSCNPFPIICGTSAGAINAAALAANAASFRVAVRGLERVWSNLTADQIYRTDLWAFVRSLLRWLLPTYLTGDTPTNSALLDSEPLRRLLSLVINFERIEAAIQRGELDALSITASSYSNGESVAFFQGRAELQEWQRARRKGKRSTISLPHLLASSAIPILFPAQQVEGQYYGDGAVRQLAPISPALHLGASHVLVIGVSGNTSAAYQRHLNQYPSLAQVLGHVLNSVFVDTLEGDVERLERINGTLAAIPEQARQRESLGLRQVDVLKIYPSQPIDEVAVRHLHKLPRGLRLLLRGSGGTQSAGAAAVSYLLFEPGFCRELIQMGYRDAQTRRDELHAFLALNAVCS